MTNELLLRIKSEVHNMPLDRRTILISPEREKIEVSTHHVLRSITHRGKDTSKRINIEGMFL